MKTFNILLVAGIISCWVLGVSAQTKSITENFDSNTVSFTSSPATAWKIDTNYFFNSPNSIRGIVPNLEGDEAELLSPVYDFSDYNNVLLRFNHICKVSPQDIARIEYRRNMGGGIMGSWTVLPAQSYLGDASINQSGMYVFNASTYPAWMAGDSLALPASSWWRKEMFDVSFETGGSDAVQFRFLLKHGSTPGSQISYGWLIDNIEILTAPYELTPPFVAFIDPLFYGIVDTTGPYEINAKVKSRTSAQIETPWLVYTTTNKGVSATNSVLMTPVSGDSLWKATIPQFVAGTEVDYSITGMDKNGNTELIASSYVITIPNDNPGDTSAALLPDMISPKQGLVQGNTVVPVEVVLKNRGDSALTSATINWTLNGVLQTPYPWTGNLSWDFKQQLTIGTYTSRTNQYDTVVVWVSMPNEVEDVYKNDDTARVTIYAYSGLQSGTYTIGQGETFTTIDEALTVLRFNPPVRDITFALKSGVYATNWDLTNISNLMGNYTLTITSLDGHRDSVTLRPASGVGITLNNSNNIRIEDITINVSTTGTYGVQFTGPCTNVVINRCNILGRLTGTTAAATYAPVYKLTNITTNSGSLINMSVTNCTISGGYSGVYLLSTSTNIYRNIRIDSNIISGQYYSGVYSSYVDLISCSYNQVSPRSSNQGITWHGLYLTQISNGGKIIGNRIKANNSGITSTISGIYTYYIDSALVANNEVIINSTASTAYGMYMVNVRGVDYLHNSVLLTGTGGATAFRAAYISELSRAYNRLTCRNNIFIAKGGTTPYAIYLSVTPDSTFSLYNYINNNNYYSVNNSGVTGNLGYTGVVARPNLATWKAIVETDSNSVSKLPDFADATNSLELRDYTSFLYCNPIPSVGLDIRDSVRKSPTVMGCYEDILENENASLAEILGVREGAMEGTTDTVKVVIMNNGKTPLNSANLEWSMTGSTNKHVTHVFNPPLESLQSDTVVLGINTYTSGNLDVEVWINTLNGGALLDEYVFNDTVSVSVWVCGGALSGVIPISDTSDFTTVTEAIRAIGICGTGGDITLVLDSGRYVETCNLLLLNHKHGNTLTLTSKTGKAEDVVIQPASGAGIILDKTRNLLIKAITVDVTSGTSPGISFLSACTNIVVRDCRLLSSTTLTSGSSTIAPVCKAPETGMADSIFFINNLIDGGYHGITFYGGQSQSLQGTHIVFDSNTISNQFYAATYIYCSDIISFSGNTLLSRENAGNTWYGIHIRESNGPVIGNRIRQRSNAPIATVYGIHCQTHNLNYPTLTLQNRTLIANNEVILIRNTAANFFGIHSSNSRADILHNSVYITGSGAAKGIYITNAPSEITVIKNNNIVLTSPLAYPVYFYSTTGAIPDCDMDYNNLYAPIYVGYAARASISSIPEWQGHTHFDLHSVSILPEYMDNTQNLKLSNYNSFYCDLLPDVVTDIEGSTRMPSTTMGCYEQSWMTANGALVKIFGLQNGQSEGSKDSIHVVFLNAGTASIDSVDVEWSVNRTSQGHKTITFSSPLTAGQQDTILLGELTYSFGTNEILVWINHLNGGALADNFLMDDTMNQSAVACSNTLGNVITVSKTGIYNSITQVIDLLSACGFSSDVTLLLDTGVYEENVNIISLNTTGNHSLTLTSITGNPEDVTIRPPSGTGILLFASNNIRIENITVDVPQGFRGIELSGRCSNIVIDNCIIFVDSTIATDGSAPVYKTSTGLNGLTVKNCIIHGGYTGIELRGTDADRYQNVIIDSNIISGQESYGVYIYYVDLNSMSYNQVTPRSSYQGTRWYGLFLYYIRGNIIGNRIRSNNSGINATVAGMYIQYITDALVANNEVYLNSSAATTQGMYLNNSTRVNYLHNTVLLTGTGGNTFRAADINVGASYSATYKNNIFVNNGSAGTRCAIRVSALSVPATHQIDYNNYYSSDNLGYTLNTARADLAAWKTAVPTDQNSTNIQPVFTDLTKDLELSSYTGLFCPYYPNVPQDIKGNNRIHITTMGAHSDSIPVFDLGIEQIVRNTAVSYPQLAPVKVKIMNVGRSVAIDSATFGWSLNGEKQSPYTWTAGSPLNTGEEIEVTVDSFSIVQNNAFDITVWIESVNGVMDSVQWNDTASLSLDVFWAGHNLHVQSIEPLVDSGELCSKDYVPLRIQVENTGAQDYDFALTPVTFSIRVNNPKPYTLDTVFSSGKIKSGEMQTIVLTDTFPIITAGIYDIEVFLNSSRENIHYDDTVRENYVSGKFGLPIDAEFRDSIHIAFISNNLNSSHKWEFVSKGTGADTVVVPQFGNGILAFKGSQGSMTALSTQQLDLSRTVQPALSFWYFHDTIPCEDYTDVRMTIDGGTTYTTLFSLTKYDATYGWKQYSMDLPSYAVNQCVRIVFEAMEKSRSGDVTQYIDRIRITAKMDIGVTKILTSDYTVCDLDNKEWKVVITNHTDPDLDYSVTPTDVTLEIVGTPYVFTQSLDTGVLEGFTSDTITMTTDFNFTPGTYQLKAWFSSVFDDTPLNDTFVTSLVINPKFAVDIHSESSSNCISTEIAFHPTVTISNIGNMELSDIDLIFQIDTGDALISYIKFKETCTDVIKAGESFTYTFDTSYIAPWLGDFFARITAYLPCDSGLIDTTTGITECVDTKDLYIDTINNPPSTAEIDHAGSSIQVSATLINRSDYKSFNGVNIHVVVENSQGVQTSPLTDTIASINALATVNHTFTKTYTVPNDPVYYLIVYTDSYDNYSKNDTIRIRRETDYVGIETLEETNAFTLAQNTPNPATSSTRIEYSVPEAGEVVFHVHSISGQLLYSQTIEAERGLHSLKLNTSTLSAGIYYYSIEYKGQRLVKQLGITK